ncbi:hypothetical protein QBC46DRAFT_384318 [Diplogelasinospora grovesii]|uniref:Uncharacterized protein n=1 Tax=Diplogelasinospora grovesii TaxID=303347 RepID=A0AAN6N8N3_9PEZI|nr:hypothetical protein QBC46DRAFT_384318 [Diplogelasinospora grovesii]
MCRFCVRVRSLDVFCSFFAHISLFLQITCSVHCARARRLHGVLRVFGSTRSEVIGLWCCDHVGVVAPVKPRVGVGT